MKFGAQVSCYLTSWDAIRSVVKTMEAGRWHSVYHADHFVPPSGREVETAYEGYSSMAAVASITNRLKLGHLVLGNTYRNPGLVAKMAGTIDHISHGRFTLAIGAGWFKREHEAYGWEFPSVRERSDRLEEACALIRALFTSQSPVSYSGRYYRLDNAVLSPGSAQDPHIPIMVGGMGERRTLRTLAMYGDAFNLDGFAAKGTWRYVPRPVQAEDRSPEPPLRTDRSGPSRNKAHSADANETLERRIRGQAVHRSDWAGYGRRVGAVRD